MRATLVTFGSRGDAEPYAALADRLVERGHDVRLVGHAMFAPMVEGSGIEFCPVRGRSVRELLDDPQVQEVVRDLRRPLRAFRRLASLIGPELHLLYEDTRAAVTGSDVVVCSPLTVPGLHAAEATRVPVVQAQLQPFVPTRAFPAPANWLRIHSLGGVANRCSYQLDTVLSTLLLRRAVDRCRAEVLGLGPQSPRAAVSQRRPRHGAVVAVSPHVVPRPADWPGDVELSGWWWRTPPTTPPASERLDDATWAFLHTGPPPVLVSLGSMPVADPGATTLLLVGAARDAGVRLLLQRGWADLGEGIEGTADVHVVDDLPHDRILPGVAGVVHHGGAGTTGRGLVHGRPTLALPVMGDQFFWGHRLRSLGAGPEPLPLAKVDRRSLADRLRGLVSDRSYQARARAVGDRLRGEDGAGLAASWVERFAARAVQAVGPSSIGA
jgi:sterol 3beta-glucosyltransferase